MPATAPACRAAAATAPPTPACGAARSSKSAPTSTTARSPISRRIRQSRNDVLFQTADARVLTDEQVGGFGRDLIDQRDNKAHPRLAAAGVAATTPSRAAPSGTAPTTSATRSTSNGQGFTTLADKYRGAGINAAQIAAGGWTGLQFDVSTTSDFNGLIAHDRRQRRPRRVLHRLRRQPRRHDLAGRSWARASCSTPPNPLGGVNYDRDFQAATGPQETFSKGLSFFVQDEIHAQPPDAERRRAHRAVGALRHDRRQHLHVPVGIRAPPQRGLRPHRQRQAQGLGVLRPLLRPHPQQHDQLRRHAHRLDHRRAGLRNGAQQVGDLPHARRPLGAGRVLLADDADAVHRRPRSSATRSTSATT